MQQETAQHQSYEEKLASIQAKWTSTIENLNAKFKTLPDLDNLLNTVYNERANACDYYFSILNILGKLTTNYKCQAAQLYNNFKLGQNGLRYSTESSIQNQIDAQLSELKQQIVMIDNHTNYMKEVIKTIDNMIFGIGQKIRIYELLNGVKK